MDKLWEIPFETLVTGGILAATTLLLLVVFFSRRKCKGGLQLPPGPRGWPIIGSMPAMGFLPHRNLLKLKDKYGPVMFMYLGSKPVLVVQDATMVREVLKVKDQVTSSRPALIVPRYLSYEQQDVAFAPMGTHWRLTRKICTVQLFTGACMKQFQSTREREVQKMIQDVLAESKRSPQVDMAHFFRNLTSNIVTQMMWQKSYRGVKAVTPEEDREALEFSEIFKEMLDLAKPNNIADFVPFVKPVTMAIQGLERRMKRVHFRLDRFMDFIIDEHDTDEYQQGAGKDSLDFVDVMIRESRSGNEIFSRTVMKAILLDMFLAGTDTTATTLEWALSELIRHRHVVAKAQKQLHEVVGPNRMVLESDIPKLPYIECIIKEVLRVHPPAPLGVPHLTTEDVTIGGYHVPADSLVFISIFALHQDSTKWENPSVFNPDRFVGSSREFKGQDFDLLPFGSGRRMCPGMNLATHVLRITLSQILHTVEWSLPYGQKGEALDMTEEFSIVCNKANALKVKARQRLAHNVLHPKVCMERGLSRSCSVFPVTAETDLQSMINEYEDMQRNQQ